MTTNYLSRQSKLVLTAGFALFAMFFGSGNLIFPLGIGVDTQGNYLVAALGLFTTGILVPFLGLFSVIYCHNSEKQYFGLLGSKFSFILILSMLCLMGPFGVGARCVLVASGGLNLLFPNMPTIALNTFVCLSIYILLRARSSVVEVIGKHLTPWLLISITAVIIFGLYQSQSGEPSPLPYWIAFQTGIHQGYQTMDLLAAFFFSTTTITYLKKQLGESATETKLVQLTLKASFIGAGLLTIIYFGFIALGANYADILFNVAPEQRLLVVAGEALGQFATPVISLLVSLACITTLCILTDLFANFLQTSVCQNKISRHLAISLTLVFTYCVSLVGFTQLAAWIAKTLYIFYPALIMYASTKILQTKYQYQKKLVNASFWITAGACFAASYF